MSQQMKLGRCATKVATVDGTTVIRYHSTDVVQFSESYIFLNSGGWLTNTTKTRMNQASNQFGLGYHVYQKDFTWYVNYKDQDIKFFDGMELGR